MSWELLFGMLGSAAFVQLVTFLINRHDKKKGILAQIQEQVKKNEKDNCRTQMLLLMGIFPQERQELFVLARRYFVDLKGDWYATTIFQSYLKQNGIPAPPWFRGSHESQEIEGD